MNVSAEAKNVRLLSHNDLGGFGNGGEGLALQKTRDGRRVLYIAHESAPKNFTVVDVSDPTEPCVLVQTDLPHAKVRSNSLDVTGDILAVAYQTTEPGLKPAGVELFDVSRPGESALDRLLRPLGPALPRRALPVVRRRRVHPPLQRRAGMQCRQTSWTTSSTRSSTCATLPSRSRWDAGGCRGRSKATASQLQSGTRRTTWGFARTTSTSIPERPDRAYVGYIDGGAIILDISDKSRPQLVSRLDYHPPMTGFTHTVLPLLSKDTLIVSDEAIRPGGEDWPKPVWVVDVRDETRPMIIGTLPCTPRRRVCRKRGGRFGAHNLHENHPLPTALRSDNLVFGAYFNAGVRIHDVSNPWAPREVGHFIPAPPERAPHGAAQMNDVYVDENGLIYAIERFTGGLYILEPSL